jgi:riboflavin kinase/FMN adenylyltransferase
VVEGDRLGRNIGYPTANLLVADPEKLIPGDGVYAVGVDLLGENQLKAKIPEAAHPLRGMMNIGWRPTVNGRNHRIEVNIFDFNKEIYGRTLRVQVEKWLRGEQKFSGLPALQEQLSRDRQEAIEIFRAGS